MKPITPILKILFPPLLLFLAAFALFAPSVRYGLVDLDDLTFVIRNPIVADGFSWASFGRAFTALHGDGAMYTPLLWISYLLDSLFFNASPSTPWGYHLTNVLLHAANAVLLYFILLAAVRRPGLAFFAAAFWAFHPLRVESVAWVTERKDTLSTFFAFASILFYLKAFSPRGGTSSPHDGGPGAQPPTSFFPLFTFHSGECKQCLALLAFATGLLSKPMLVTLPFLFLLLDWWPLRRFPLRDAPRALPRLALRKWPFFLLGTVFSIFTYRLQTSAIADLPLSLRLVRIPVNYLYYLVRTFFPVNLCPVADGFPHTLPWLLAAGTAFILLAIPAIRLVRRAPGVCVGILAFAGLLFPVCGIVFVGSAPVADRYTYLPSLGISLALVAFPALRPPRLAARRPAILVLMAAILAAEALSTTRLLPVWRSSSTLFERVRRLSPGQRLLAVYDFRHAQAAGNYPAARDTAFRFLQANPSDPQFAVYLAMAIANTDGPAQAFDFLAARRPAPGQYLGAWAWEMATLALRLGRPDDALAFAGLSAADLPPGDGLRHNLTRLRDAAASTDPAAALPHYISQWKLYERSDALEFFRGLVAAYPSRPDVLANVAWILSTADWSPAPPSEALDYATRAIALAGGHPPPGLFDTYAAALANAADYPAAAAAQQHAIDLLPSASPSLPAYLARLGLYLHSTPCREDIGLP